MKIDIKSFVIGLLAFGLLSATTITSNLLTMKPATPVSVVTYNGQNPDLFTTKWAKKGYQVSSSASQGYYNTYVVMVRY